MKHRLVALDGAVEIPALNFDCEITQYEHTSPLELPGRIHDATLVTTSFTTVTRAALENASNLQLVHCNGTGTDHVDKEALRERGITLCHVPAQNTDSVAEHAFALYFAVKRSIVPMHNLTMTGSAWLPGGSRFAAMGQPPRTNAEETLVVLGYGAVGRTIERIGIALGMRVLVSERKAATETRCGRISFESAIRRGTLFMLAIPLDDSTRNMISRTELESMNRTAIVVNIGRGGVIHERALVAALREGQIMGAAVDVFEQEPATPANSNLLDPSIRNLVVSPHVAWYSSRTIRGTTATIKANLENFVAGNATNVIVAAGDATNLDL